MSIGKIMRMRNLIDPESGTSLIFAHSHGTTSPVVLEGYSNAKSNVRQAIAGGANVIFLSRGYIKHCIDEFEKSEKACYALKISASCPIYSKLYQEVLTGTVDEALRLGANAVVPLIQLTPDNEKEVISLLGKLGMECEEKGMPFITEAEFPSAYHKRVDLDKDFYNVEYLKRCVRLCAEMGADIIKTNWTGDIDSFSEVVGVSPVPVVVAGGSKESTEDFLRKIELALEAGAIGCSVGRNIFQAPDPGAKVKAISMILKKEGKAPEVAKMLEAGELAL